jgi:hypothetical protein
VPPHQVQGRGYSESEVETDVAALQLETSTGALELETDAATLELDLNAAALELETYAITPHVSNPHDYINQMFKRP